MVILQVMNSLLLLLILACRSRYAIAEASLNESGGAGATINIATAISAHGLREQAYPSSSLDQDGHSTDFVLVGNTSTAEKWLRTAAGYAAAADSRVIFEMARWALLEDGARHEKLSTFWARFHGVNSTASSSQTICTMVVKWEGDSWTDDEAVLAAVEIEGRLKVNCGENDTIALAFTSAITDAVDAYLEGEIAVNDAAAPIPLQDVDNTMLSDVQEASSRDYRLFVRLAGDICMRDGSTATSFDGTKMLVVSLLVGDPCAGLSGSNLIPPHAQVGSDDKSDLKHELILIIPVGVCIFLVGCVGLFHVIRHQKSSPPKLTPTSKPS